MEVRPFEDGDADALWELKRGFETGLGEGTGGEAKAAAYEAKLTDEYRTRYLSWVKRCVAEDANAVTVAVEGTGGADEDATAVAEGGDESRNGRDADGDTLAGYAFVLPQSLAFVWDAAVLNELYVRPAHRGTGVGDDLVAAALETARAQDLPLDRMVLDVDRANDRARAFYDRHGFARWGEMLSRDL